MRRIIVASALLFFLCIVTPHNSSAAQTVHKVKQGDNLYSIAKTYHLSVDQLKSQNNLKSIKLSLGQTLIIKDDKERTAVNKSTENKYCQKETAPGD